DKEEQAEHLRLHAQNIVERLEDKIRELESANRRLRELDRLKSDFILLVSHELRTPLTLVSGYAHLLAEHVRQAGDVIETTKVENIAQGLKSGVSRMQGVVNEIISVARISSGNLDLSLGPVRLEHLVQNIVKELQPILQQRQLNLKVGDLSRLPIIEGDGQQIKHAIEQVIGNAIKYTPDGGDIFIIGRTVGNAVDLIIRDTGIGIPVEEQRHIFDQFYAVEALEHHSTSKHSFQGGGLGLGLAIAKGIVEAHNGRIWVESEGRNPENPPGSTFHILLPLKQVRASSEERES
ncbi:MAG: sensor histidine kinase, partial [Chloroflexi bacterium]